jgi:hypothetical protein
MHKIELLVTDFLRKVGKSTLQLQDEFYLEASKNVDHYLRKMYEENPKRKFSLRLSSIGRPLCQQQMEQAEAQAVDDEWNFPLRMMYGAIIESLTVVIMKHAGVNIEEEQTHVKLAVNHIEHTEKPNIVEISGTLDVVIDGRVYDIKSASSHSFTEKFKCYESLKESDNFGYIEQLYGYAEAKGLPPGGWIVIDKSSGDFKVIEVPDNWKEDSSKSIVKIQDNVNALLNKVEFKRQFEDRAEVVKKVPTGNRFISSPCTYCKFRYECWKGLQHKPSASSTAYDKPTRYYTVYNENTER